MRGALATKQSIQPLQRVGRFAALAIPTNMLHPSIFRNSAFATFSSVERGMSSTK